jgi:Beta-lactamase
VNRADDRNYQFSGEAMRIAKMYLLKWHDEDQVRVIPKSTSAIERLGDVALKYDPRQEGSRCGFGPSFSSFSRRPLQHQLTGGWSRSRERSDSLLTRGKCHRSRSPWPAIGQILWEAAFGWANREQLIEATPQAPYSLASISKPFTATAVMTLVEHGQLALDRQANDYLGDARIAGHDTAKATVRRVLSHTAGLPPYFRPFFASQAQPIEELIERDALLSSPPGRRHVYSNLGYGILEHIIARASGTSYEEYLRRNIFAPLRLESASVPLAPVPHAAVRYDARNQPLTFYDLGHRGASSVFASAHDLVRFGMFHLKGRRPGSPADSQSPKHRRNAADSDARITH